MRPSSPLASPGSAGIATAVALLVVCSLVVAGGALAQDGGDSTSIEGVQPQPADGLQLPERVVLPGTQLHSSTTVDADAGAALERGASRIEGSYRSHLLQERVDAATDETARRTIVNRTASRLADDVETLRAREESARDAYRTGTLSTRDYLAELAAIDARARALDAVADRIAPIAQGNGLAAETGAQDGLEGVRAIRGSITASRGPVRAALGDVLGGTADERRFHVFAAAEGSLLASIAQGSYHREAHRSDTLVDGLERGIGLSEAFQITETELYPIYSSTYGFSRVREEVPGQYYLGDGQGERTYEHGALQSYIDAVSRNVFWEYQRLDLDDDLPLRTAIVNDSAVAVDGAGGAPSADANESTDGTDDQTDGGAGGSGTNGSVTDRSSTNETSTDGTVANGETADGTDGTASATAGASQAGDLTLRVRPTYSTGPALVNVTAGDAPVSGAEVAVNGVTVDRTTDSGEVWVILPGGAPDVTVTYEGRRVSATVQWPTEY